MKRTTLSDIFDFSAIKVSDNKKSGGGKTSPTYTDEYNEKTILDIRFKLIEVRQTTSIITLTKDDVNSLRMLFNKELCDNVYTTQVYPRTRMELKAENVVYATPIDDENNTPIRITKGLYERILAYRKENSPKIAWSMDFRRRRY